MEENQNQNQNQTSKILYDIDEGKITDYGKVTEFGSFRLFRSSIDGNIYSASRSGYFYRINTDTQEIEELGIFFNKDYEPYSTEKHVQLDYIADGKDGKDDRENCLALKKVDS